MRQREVRPPLRIMFGVASIVVVGGMTFAKFGAAHGFPVVLLYGIPAALTWLLPPLALRMAWREHAIYLPLALLSAPAMHVTFSLLLGWKEYMPFLPIPSLAELRG